jgi:predicted DNA-binding transcriptional regulator YafY
VVDFERETIALSQLCALGRGAEVLAPEQLRERLIAVAAGLQATYGSCPTRRRASGQAEHRGVGR